MKQEDLCPSHSLTEADQQKMSANGRFPCPKCKRRFPVDCNLGPGGDKVWSIPKHKPKGWWKT